MFQEKMVTKKKESEEEYQKRRKERELKKVVKKFGGEIKEEEGVLDSENKDIERLEKAKQDTGLDYIKLFKWKRLKFLESEKDSEILRIQPDRKYNPVFVEIFRNISEREKKEREKEGITKRVLEKLAQKEGKRKATELLTQEILNRKKIYTVRDDEKVEMWIYNEGIYVPQAKTYIKEFCRKILGGAYTPYLSNEVIAKIEVDSYIDQKEFFGKNIVDEIAVENGILILKTRELKPFTEDKVFFNKLPITYDPSKKCKSISKFFKEVLKNEEDVPVVEELFGFLLWKEYTMEKAFMFSGSGRNGKGKTLELMKRFLGAENCVNIPIQDFDTDQFALGELFGKLANLSGDISRRALYQTGAFKNLTGRDTISASRKFLPKVHFQNYAKQIFCANELPITYDNTLAFWNRWVLFEFPYIFLSKKEFDALSDEEEKKNVKLADPEIIDKIATDEELSGLLNLALDGLKRILKQRDFSYSKNTAEVKDMWIRKSDSFSAFLMDCIEESYEGKIIKQELKRAYSIYCKNHKVTMSGDKIIKNLLTTNFAVSEERDRTEGNQTTYWSGIMFKSGMGGIDGNGFSTHRLDAILPIGKNTHTNLTTHTKSEIEKKTKKPQKTLTNLTITDGKFKVIEKINPFTIINNGEEKTLNLKKGKEYNLSILGENTDVFKILLNQKKIKKTTKQ